MEAKGGNGAFRKEEGQIRRHWKQSLQRTLSFGLGLMLRGAPAKKEYRSCPRKRRKASGLLAVRSAGKKPALDVQTRESNCPCRHHAHSPMQQDKVGAKVRASRPELQARWRKRRQAVGQRRALKGTAR